MVLWLWEDVLLLFEWGRVGLISTRIIVHLRILSQVVEEGTLLIGWLVDRLQAAGTIRYVSVPATSIVSIANRLWVDIGQWLGRSLFRNYEGTYVIRKIKSLAWFIPQTDQLKKEWSDNSLKDLLDESHIAFYFQNLDRNHLKGYLLTPSMRVGFFSGQNPPLAM